MIRQRHRTTAGIFLTGDLIATLAAFFASWFLRFEIEVIPVTKNVPEFAPYLRLVPIVLVLWTVVFYFHGLYQNRRGRSRVDEVLTIAMAVLVATVLLSVFLAWYRPPAWPGSTQVFTFSRAFVGLFALVDLLLVAVMRMAIRFALHRIRLSGLNLQRILVVGAGALGREITAKIQAHREIGFEVVGFLDDDPGKAGTMICGVPVLGSLRQADEILATYGIDQVYIALPLEAHKKMLQMIDLMARECVEIKLVPDILQYAALRAGLEDVDGTPVINLSQVPLQGWSSMVKRAMDIGMAVAVMAALVPIIPLIALLIWLEDRGPIFYRQVRMGLDGKPFDIFKFRSMRVGAEKETGAVWAEKDDPRRTRVGRFIRAWSLDELPQLLNVLVGDMSVIGPRPERPEFVEQFRAEFPHYMLRHKVRAGMTGWAQVHGWRGNTSIRMRIEHDLYYIENWSLALDVKILFLTIAHGLRHENAY